MAEKFLEQARIAFQRLSPHRGDIIGITVPNNMSYEQVKSIVTYIQDVASEFGCAVIILSQGVEITALSETEMNELGWFKGDPTRKPKVH